MSYNFYIPCCEPIDNLECCLGKFNEKSPQKYSLWELEQLPQCPPRCPPPRPRCITIQQPPRLICRKRVVFVPKIIPEPLVVNRCRMVALPKVVEITKVIKVPKLHWVPQLIKESRVVYFKTTVPDPHLICIPRRILEPRTLCQMLICKPQPQVISVPTPPEYCCYPLGPTKYKPSVSCQSFCEPKCSSILNSKGNWDSCGQCFHGEPIGECCLCRKLPVPNNSVVSRNGSLFNFQPFIKPSPFGPVIYPRPNNSIGPSVCCQFTNGYTPQTT